MVALLCSVGGAARAETTEELKEVGPFWGTQRSTVGQTSKSLRPFWEEVRDADGNLLSGSVLYPLWHTEIYPEATTRSWSLLNLIQYERNESAGVTRLDAWPIYFSRDTDSQAADAAELDYHALFPIYGDVPQRLSQDRLQFVLFPLYGRFEKAGVVTTTTPWPFIKTVTGDVQHGFEFWPLGGRRAALDDSYAESFALWPLYYRKRLGPANDPTTLQTGLLPFYALDRSPGYISETYGWPFFGYVDRTAPYRYHATHYFWPLWVQGRGEGRYINRWAPFYSHSNLRGSEKTWILWPLWREATWRDQKLEHRRRQFLYFVYHATQQSSLYNPDAAPATKTHLWPLFSAWDNGAGRHQVQVLSPLEVFFPHNDRIRRLWSPLFALYRYNANEARGRTEHRLLWGLVKWKSDQREQARAFSLGPLLTFRTQPGEQRLSFLGDRLGLDFDGQLHAWARDPASSSAASP